MSSQSMPSAPTPAPGSSPSSSTSAAAVSVGAAPLHFHDSPVSGEPVHLMGETFYRISNYNQMPPFFMSLVSSSDHWLFISSTGGLTAGRRDAESALFPYDTEDKVAANFRHTGPQARILATREGRTQLWEPFGDWTAERYRCQRNLYKNVAGNKLVFEEINHDLQLTYRYAWRTGERFGFIKSSWLHNHSGDVWHVALLDGLENLLPYGATTALQTSFSNLLDAYKRNEIEAETGLGIFALSATLTDRAEPSESLMATVAWQVGLDADAHLLCTDQVAHFRQGRSITPETDVRGRAGAYLTHATFALQPNEVRHWHVVADVNQDSRAVVALAQLIATEHATLAQQLEDDIRQGTAALVQIVAAADGLQHSAVQSVAAHHFANVLFN
ncbi:MAG: hypothetical protein KDD78_20340, partial [Caldilineaceae bacterium]|nr:hypothetical protein [Caldilineaceae bacterium]